MFEEMETDSAWLKRLRYETEGLKGAAQIVEGMAEMRYEGREVVKVIVERAVHKLVNEKRGQRRVHIARDFGRVLFGIAR